MGSEIRGILPYVYKCTRKVSGQFYIGYRERNVKLGRVPEIDLPIYKTSSKKIKSNFDEYDWEIIALMFDAESAYEFEQQLIREFWNDPLCLNENIGGKKRRDNSGRVVVRDKSGNIFQVSKNDPKYISGEYEFYAKNIKRSDSFKEAQSKANHGKVNMRNSDGLVIRVSVDDLRIPSGELTPMNTGSKRTRETRHKQSKSANSNPKLKLVCRLFDKMEMDIANYTRWAEGNYVGDKSPKIKCCRLSDRKVIAVNHLNRNTK